jgi:serine/threonine protein kinase
MRRGTALAWERLRAMTLSNAASKTEFDFGPYRVLSRLASGGMADVWLAETSISGAPMRAVLKTMRTEIASSRELSAMFVEEALVAAQLRHENVVKVLDVGAIDGRHYIAMEYVRGCTLRQIGQRYQEQQKRFDAWFLLRVVLGACAALEYVHGFVDETGWPLTLVHGDVSPENIMVSFSGVVKLVDFGIARASKSASAGQGTFVVGKPWYMAPERLCSGSVDGRSDLYALGIILYEYLTGYRPFTGAIEAVVMARVLEGRPAPPEELADGISKSLAAATLRAMARDPEARFPSASHLAVELGARLKEIDSRAPLFPLDAHMARLFGDRDAVSSSVRLAGGVRAKHDSELPTTPSDPAVLEAALALLDDRPPAKDPVSEPRTRSGIMPALRVPPPLPSSPSPSPSPVGVDIFAQAPRRQSPDVFGTRDGSARTRSTRSTPPAKPTEVIARSPLSEKAQQAARLFEEGLAAAALGQNERARDAWRGAMELDPTQRRYEANLRRLEERLGNQRQTEEERNPHD